MWNDPKKNRELCKILQISPIAYEVRGINDDGTEYHGSFIEDCWPGSALRVAREVADTLKSGVIATHYPELFTKKYSHLLREKLCEKYVVCHDSYRPLSQDIPQIKKGECVTLRQPGTRVEVSRYQDDDVVEIALYKAALDAHSIPVYNAWTMTAITKMAVENGRMTAYFESENGLFSLDVLLKSVNWRQAKNDVAWPQDERAQDIKEACEILDTMYKQGLFEMDTATGLVSWRRVSGQQDPGQSPLSYYHKG